MCFELRPPLSLCLEYDTSYRRRSPSLRELLPHLQLSRGGDFQIQMGVLEFLNSSEGGECPNSVKILIPCHLFESTELCRVVRFLALTQRRLATSKGKLPQT